MAKSRWRQHDTFRHFVDASRAASRLLRRFSKACRTQGVACVFWGNYVMCVQTRLV